MWPGGKVQRLADEPALDDISTMRFSQFGVDQGQHGAQTQALWVTSLRRCSRAVCWDAVRVVDPGEKLAIRFRSSSVGGKRTAAATRHQNHLFHLAPPLRCVLRPRFPLSRFEPVEDLFPEKKKKKLTIIGFTAARDLQGRIEGVEGMIQNEIANVWTAPPKIESQKEPKLLRSKQHHVVSLVASPSHVSQS